MKRIRRYALATALVVSVCPLVTPAQIGALLVARMFWPARAPA